MRQHSLGRLKRLLIPSMLLFQLGGCDLTMLNDTLQTVFLAITAAGSAAILQNI